MSEPWYPANYCGRVGAERCPPAGDGPPHYPAIPTISVVDLGAKRLKARRQKFWRKARDVALTEWEAGGLVFAVSEPLPEMGYQPGRITLDLTQTHDGTRGQADFGFLPEYPVTSAPEIPAPGVAWAHIDPESTFTPAWLARNIGMLRTVICHEIGHTLGFGHGGTGIMSPLAGGHINAEEIAALRAYWF